MDEGDVQVRVRWPQPGDEALPFEAEGGLRGRVPWPRVLREHDPSAGTLLWIADCGGEVVGLALGQVTPNGLEIELLARNSASVAARGLMVGQRLIRAAIAMAWSMALPCLTLDSLDEPGLLAFYEGRGFVRDGPPFYDAAWGTLHPMRRAVRGPPP